MLWGVSWININMMMHDFPHWEYDTKGSGGKKDEEEDEIIEDITQLIGRI